ncbi:hypothetical protein [Fuchsiella alkaliacetigena]|uniref:hypothetical protein n=1 Tax=Fuchsiella alkaliacetigena TaxID=957042 RepID=UPI00200A04C7|nr:hypothetical protein [Fuchsiella alkaliacetigena]MCK8824947.1 hypothetical protein [Fuchsiella alkaliacetigena]
MLNQIQKQMNLTINSLIIKKIIRDIIIRGDKIQSKKEAKKEIIQIRSQLEEELNPAVEKQLKLKLQKIISQHEDLANPAQIEFQEADQPPYAVFDSEDAEKYLD